MPPLLKRTGYPWYTACAGARAPVQRNQRRDWHGGRRGHRSGGPRGRGENDPVRVHAVSFRHGAPTGTRGSRGCLSGYGKNGEGTGHHHLLQAGTHELEKDSAHPAGHAGAYGFLRRDGAGSVRDGCRGAGGQRDGGSTVPYPHALAPAGKERGSRSAVYEQNGPVPGRSRRASRGDEARPFGPDCGFHGGGSGGGRGAVRRGDSGCVPPGGRSAGKAGPFPGAGAEGLSLLFRRGASQRGRGSTARLSCRTSRGGAGTGGLWSAGLQNRPGSPGRAADLSADHGRGASSAGSAGTAQCGG